MSSRRTLLLSRSVRALLCMADFFNGGYHGFMKADWRISIKDYHRNKNLKIQMVQVPFAAGHRSADCPQSAAHGQTDQR
ncbi:MAG: hypothetical protein PHY43_08850 [Verrucomicrobiales bacterium]|nr:hypothetical protein [Verrucomicrobiales bacterium]